LAASIRGSARLSLPAILKRLIMPGAFQFIKTREYLVDFDDAA
jgi:hypothetical protein